MRNLDDKSILEKADRVISVEIEELGRLKNRLDENFVKAVRLLIQTIEQGNKLIVLGVGKSGHIGEKISATFVSIGCVSIVLNSLNALHGDLGIIQDGDLVLALSYSGETEELLRILPGLERFNVKIIGITGSLDSTLAKLSNVALDVSVLKEACPLELAPTSSTTSMLALGDALAMVILEAKGLSSEEFSKYHPGGSLGRALLTSVTEIMRDRDRITTVGPHERIGEILHKMTVKRNGAAVIEDPETLLLGIFTHGDLARLFNKHAGLAGEEVEKFMTSNPICILDSAFAVEALALLREHRVDEIVVVDRDRKVRGTIDVQDLSRHRLL